MNSRNSQSRNNRLILVALPDFQSGSRFGLMNPDTTLFDEDENGNLAPYIPQLTATQVYLWKCFLEDTASVIDLAGGDPVHTLYMGDITQGTHFKSELVSTRLSDQIVIATNVLEQFCRYAHTASLRMVIGTEVHEMGEGSAAILVAEQLKAKFPGIHVQPINHLLASVGGVVVDAAHHGPPPGSRIWLAGNQARLYLQDIMLKSLVDGEAPPDLVLRAHYHVYVHEQYTLMTRKRDYPAHIIIVPSYCLLDMHARKTTRSVSLHDIGLVAFEIVGGKIVQVHKFSRRLDLRTREIIV